MTTFDEFRQLVRTEECQAASRSQRRGQFAMNRLCDVRPDLYQAFTNTTADPFYNDDVLPDFWVNLQSLWDNPQHAIIFVPPEETE